MPPTLCIVPNLSKINSQTWKHVDTNRIRFTTQKPCLYPSTTKGDKGHLGTHSIITGEHITTHTSNLKIKKGPPPNTDRPRGHPLTTLDHCMGKEDEPAVVEC